MPECNNALQRTPLTTTEWAFQAIGTQWQIDTEHPIRPAEQAAVGDLIERFDATWSRFRADSLMSQIAAEAGTWTMPPEAGELFALYTRLHEITGGAVSALIGRTLADLGYDEAYTLRPSEHPSAVPPPSVLHWSPPRLHTSTPVLLDVGAAGKGLLVDLIGDELAPGHRSFTIDASGDLRHHGAAPLRVALEHPGDTSIAVGVAEVPAGHALCASAANRRVWGERLHHVLDARTGAPTYDVLATWAMAPTCMLADGVATAAFFTAPAELAAEFEVAVVRLRADGTLQWSANFPGEMFT